MFGIIRPRTSSLVKVDDRLYFVFVMDGLCHVVSFLYHNFVSPGVRGLNGNKSKLSSP